MQRGLPSSFLWATGLLMVSLAGCLGGGPSPDAEVQPPVRELAPLSEALFQVLEGVSEWIPASSDGARLHARLFLPETSPNPEWKSPAILVMSPYNGHDEREETLDPSSRPLYFRDRWLIDHFVPRGYVVALADVRGTGDSGGCLEQTGKLQRQDGYDLVEWLAAQPWSNGRVGMIGKSYDAETQQGTAVLSPPHLTTIVPVSSVSGQYEWNFFAGVPFSLHSFGGAFGYMVDDGLQPPTSTTGLQEYPSRAPCQPAMLAQGLDMSGDWNEYWEEREFRKLVEGVQASVLYVHGLQDWNVRNVAIRDWFDRIPSEKRALFGQWAHDYPEQNRWKPEWSRPDWRPTVHQWFDYWLLGLDNGILDELPPVQVQDSTGAWRREQTFPPTDAQPYELFLGDGVMTRKGAQEQVEPLLLREDGEGFARHLTGLPVTTVPSDPYEVSLTFTSETFDEEMHMSGAPRLSFRAALHEGLLVTPLDDELDAHFAANLWVVHADGSQTWVNAGYLSARHRQGVDSPENVPEGSIALYEMDFHFQDTVIDKGESLRLRFAMSDGATQPQGCFCVTEFYGGTFSLPEIERDWDAVRLDVVHGAPIAS